MKEDIEDIFEYVALTFLCIPIVIFVPIWIIPYLLYRVIKRDRK